jgi:hypothetical protein
MKQLYAYFFVHFGASLYLQYNTFKMLDKYTLPKIITLKNNSYR